MSRSTPWITPGAAIVLTAALAFVVHAHLFRFTVDDTYISLQYAKSLVEGDGLVFNPGERVEGYSNFSWTMLLALLLALGLPALDVARWIGVGCGAATVLVAARFARAIERGWGLLSLATAVLVATCSALALWSTSGLETALFVLLITSALERGLAPDVSERGRRLAPILFAAAALTRPDGPLLFALWFATRLPSRARTAGGRRAAVLDAALFTAPLLPFLAFKLAYYGSLLPNTYYAKAGVSSVYIARGLDYAREFFHAYGAWGLAPALAALSLRPRETRSLFASLLAVAAGYAAYVVAIGGDVLIAMRFWLPIVPTGCLLVAAGAREVGRLVLPRGRVALTAGIVVTLAATALVRNWDSIQHDRTTFQRHFERMRDVGRFWGARLGAGEAIAATAIGAIRYYSGRPVIDMLGLTDEEIARRPRPIEGLADTWREKKYNAESVLRRRPAVIVFSTAARPSANSEKALFLYEDFHRSYFAYTFRPDPAQPGKETVYRLRPDAPDPPEQYSPYENPEFVEQFAAGLYKQTGVGRDLPRAVRHFAESARVGPSWFTEALAWQASLLDGMGDPDALSLLEEVVARDSLALRAVRSLAYRRLEAGDLSAAEALFRRSAEANPDSPDPWEGLARVARRREQYPETAALAARAIERWNTNVSSLVLFGNASLMLGDVDAAESAFLRALDVRPGLEAAERGLALARQTRAR